MGGRVEGAWGGGFGWSSGIESETPIVWQVLTNSNSSYVTLGNMCFVNLFLSLRHGNLKLLPVRV